jgi:hypothetical protein
MGATILRASKNYNTNKGQFWYRTQGSAKVSDNKHGNARFSLADRDVQSMLAWRD